MRIMGKDRHSSFTKPKSKKPTSKTSPKPILSQDSPKTEAKTPTTKDNSIWRTVEKKEILTVIGGVATVVGLSGAFFTSGLQIGGYIDMALAHWLIFFAWFVLVFGASVLLFAWERLDSIRWLIKTIFLLVFMIISGAVVITIDSQMVNKRAEVDRKAEQKRLVAPQKPKPIEQKFLGYLVPANEPTPVSRCGEPSPNSIKVLLGDSEGYTDNNNTMNLISAFGEPLLTAKKVGNGLQISLELFNSEGASIAKIKDGMFVGQVSENLEIVSRDPHGIDIFDKPSDKLVFHIRYLNPQAIEILGEFYAKKGKIPLLIKEDGVALPNGMYYHKMCFENLRGWAMGF